MAGRHKKAIKPIYRRLCAETENGKVLINESFPIRCPYCGSSIVRTHGTQARKNTRVEGFKCADHGCEFLKDHNEGKQFTITSSFSFVNGMKHTLQRIIELFAQSTRSKREIAKDFGVTPALITFLYHKYIEALENLHNLDVLVVEPQEDTAISIDETFIKIDGKNFYIIIATGYATRRVLALRVSESRKEEDLRALFDEADLNTKHPISIVTADAWNGTRAMIKNLNRPITFVIHKHKKPYDKAVIWKIEYYNTIRKITEIGIKTDFFKRRGKREFNYTSRKQNTISKPKRKRGRPKGVKNGQGKKRKKSRKPKKKRGRKSLFAVFKNGKKGYAKVDPYHVKIRVGCDIPWAVNAALKDVNELFSQKFVQNNVAEYINSVISSYLPLTGPKTVDSIERTLKSFFLLRNHPELIDCIRISHQFQRAFSEYQIINFPYREVVLS
ncbi:MAG: DDE-type integrase/transposase/recombinase [Candidatus Lokiarchaeota archaeon]|nr:DDE-type integrase/transposase/recombinase [Candidatus Lokiarchaeota archaeon]